MQAFVSDLPKKVFHKNIFIDRTEKRNIWEGSLNYELRLKHELGFFTWFRLFRYLQFREAL